MGQNGLWNETGIATNEMHGILWFDEFGEILCDFWFILHVQKRILFNAVEAFVEKTDHGTNINDLMEIGQGVNVVGRVDLFKDGEERAELRVEETELPVIERAILLVNQPKNLYCYLVETEFHFIHRKTYQRIGLLGFSPKPMQQFQDD